MHMRARHAGMSLLKIMARGSHFGLHFEIIAAEIVAAEHALAIQLIPIVVHLFKTHSFGELSSAAGRPHSTPPASCASCACLPWPRSGSRRGSGGGRLAYTGSDVWER